MQKGTQERKSEDNLIKGIVNEKPEKEKLEKKPSEDDNSRKEISGKRTPRK